MALIAQLVKSYNASLIAQLIKNPLAMWETPVQFLVFTLYIQNWQASQLYLRRYIMA